MYFIKNNREFEYELLKTFKKMIAYEREKRIKMSEVLTSLTKLSKLKRETLHTELLKELKELYKSN